MPILGSLDVRLMRTLHILLTECSVSRTAEILGQSQPTVSLTLKRLRKITGDPLLVRSGNHLVPTRRGHELRAQVAHILEEIEHSFGAPDGFDPATTRRRFRIIADNCLSTLMVPQTLARLYSMAPNATFDVCPLPATGDLGHALAEEGIDLAVANAPGPPELLRAAPLFETEIACVVGASHPLAHRQRLSMAEFLELDHISPSPPEAAGLSPIDGRLRELGLSRHIAASVPEFALAPYVISQTDLVFTTCRPFAELVAQMMPLAVFDAPAELGSMTFQLLWHERVHKDPANLWLRRTIRALGAEMKSVVRVPGEAPQLLPAVSS